MKKKFLIAGFVSMFVFVVCSVFSQDYLGSSEEALMDLFQLTEEEAQMVVIYIEEIKMNKTYIENESLIENKDLLFKEIGEETENQDLEVIGNEMLVPREEIIQ